MTVTPEIEIKTETPPEGVEHRPEEVGIPERIQDIATPTPSQVVAQVTDDDDQDLIFTPETKEIAIEIPANQAFFDEQSKGSAEESSTWFAAFWIRIIKKARHFGWRVVGNSTKVDNGTQGSQVSDDSTADGEN